MNIPVDVTDPRMQFRGSWGSDPNDPDRASYHNQTFQATAQDGDVVLMDWTGGDVTIVGNAKANHGFYSVSLDAGPKQYFNGYSASPRTRVVLWTSSGLTGAGQHHVEVRNENAYMRTGETQDRLWLDIDYMAFIAPPQQAQQTPADNASPATSAARASSSTQAQAAQAQSTTQPATSAPASGTGTTLPSSQSAGSSSSSGSGSVGSSASSSSASSTTSVATTAVNNTLPGAFSGTGLAPAITAAGPETFPFIIQAQAMMTTGTPRLAVRLPGADVQPYTSSSRGTAPLYGSGTGVLAVMAWSAILLLKRAARPLPVEKSQGSVSSLVARFQTAADHNAATAERERSRDTSRRSSSSSAGSGASLPGINGARVTSGTGAPWQKRAGAGSEAPAARDGPKGENMPGPKRGGGAEPGHDEGMEVLKGEEGVEGVMKGIKETSMLDEGDDTSRDRANGSTSNSAAPGEKKLAAPVFPSTTRTSKIVTPVKAPPTPRAKENATAALSQSPSAKSHNVPTSPTARTRTISKSSSGSGSGTKSAPRTAVSSVKAPISPRELSGKQVAGDNGEKPAKDVGENATAVAGSPAAPRSGHTASRNTADSNPAAARAVSTVPAGAANGTPKIRAAAHTADPKSPSIPSSAPKAATPSAGTVTPRTAPSASKPAKALTPSVTGPAGSATKQRPSPVIGQPAISPLRPQLTGAPSKPTASSLAKARNGALAVSDLPPLPSGTATVGRAASKRLSMGPTSTPPSRSARASTQSPVQVHGTKLTGVARTGGSDEPKLSGSSSMSRLMQGTAASRAKAANHPVHVSSQSPGKTGSPAKKKAGEGAARVTPAARQETPSGPFSNTSPDLGSAPATSATARPGDSNADRTKPSAPRDGQQGPPSGSMEQDGATAAVAAAADGSPTAVQADLRSASAAPSAGLTEPVGESPIGRIGLAAAHTPESDTRGADATSDIGQHPSVVAVPDSADVDSSNVGSRHGATASATLPNTSEPSELEHEEKDGSNGHDAGELRLA